MKLRRIQLVGFKSFKDRVTIDLTDDMNGIVGPNGCGKSNVVDALKWAMGDMSAKSLRGAALSDVIFAGSQNHRAAGMAEVTLTFENQPLPADSAAVESAQVESALSEPASTAGADSSAPGDPSALANDDGADGPAERAAEHDDASDLETPEHSDESTGLSWHDAVPREYRQMAEISITRRLYRSGESEYLINKTPCRLMDIQNLLAGTGLGKQGYSIIEQGEISFVVSARPEQRRLIIEEASGITRYKSQRERAQRNLERARENLRRVEDVVAEVDKQLRSLERQARRAERHRELSEELRVLEIAAIVARRVALSHKAAELRDALEAGRAEAEAAQAALKKCEGELSSQKVEAFVADKKSAEATEHFYRLDTRLNLAKSNKKHLQESLADARARHARALSEQDEQTRRKSHLEQELLRVQGELTQLEHAPQDTQDRIVQAEAELADLKQQLQAADAQRAQARVQLEQAHAEVRRVQDRQAWLGSQQTELRERRARVDQDAAAAERDLEDLRRAHNRLQMDLERSLEAIEEAKGQGARAQDTHDRAREALVTARKELEELRAERVDLAARVKSLNEMRRRGEGYTRGVQRVLEWARGRADVLSPVGDLLQVPEGDEAAVSAYVGEVFSDIVVTNRQAALDAIAMLSAQKIGRAGFLVLDEHGGDVGERLKGLLEGLQVVDDLDAEQGAFDVGPGDAAQIRARATRAGDIEFATGRIMGGHLGAQAETVLRQARELKALQEKLAQVEAWEVDAQEEFDSTQDRVNIAEENVRAARKALAQFELDQRRIEQEILGEEREAQRAANRLRQIQADVAPLEERLAKVQQDAAELDGRVDELLAQTPDLARAAQECADRCETLQTQVDQCQGRVTEHKINLAQASERRRNLVESIERLQRSVHAASAQIQKLQQEAAQQQARVAECESDSSSTHIEVDTLEAEFAAAKQGADAARAHLEAVQNDMRRLELAALERRRLVEQRVGQLQQLEMSLREAGIEIEHVDQSLLERYSLSFFEASQHAQAHEKDHPEFANLDPAARDQRVKALRSELDKMGPVNPMAIHEFEEARERREFLETQQLDLHASIDDLNKAIRRMDRESRKRFQQTFDAVNERFQQFFPRLFRGGSARLMLTDPENVLESGVDIEVSPPGKRLQNVTLLSGGEKALTAVSLIFAIFSLKPTPFSVLDEVDAPLDEANVGRYAEMVRELSKQSQMIVITHNRRSMEVCDTLYGVTMEEPGVSKVVSVRLQQLDGIDARQVS